ncbi:hypothetical protein BCR32DRAFT_285579 [Anaeromyces robustus]|uniref:Uncharacterized protein n=1 Tax=Anaeromyces robustus TaxID=1754192 RepID=A0A1Y1WJI9_9FUNG|nr:hypothetical protein BCR32DRAFT_285579 [Anaeromyces robustus]|eukprot:ORX73498.1 hypothetical protein BCR32DRAFT_285579 [Anaeromyces robustus]
MNNNTIEKENYNEIKHLLNIEENIDNNNDKKKIKLESKIHEEEIQYLKKNPLNLSKNISLLIKYNNNSTFYERYIKFVEIIDPIIFHTYSHQVSELTIISSELSNKLSQYIKEYPENVIFENNNNASKEYYPSLFIPFKDRNFYHVYILCLLAILKYHTKPISLYHFLKLYKKCNNKSNINLPKQLDIIELCLKYAYFQYIEYQIMFNNLYELFSLYLNQNTLSISDIKRILNQRNSYQTFSLSERQQIILLIKILYINLLGIKNEIQDELKQKIMNLLNEEDISDISHPLIFNDSIKDHNNLLINNEVNNISLFNTPTKKEMKNYLLVKRKQSISMNIDSSSFESEEENSPSKRYNLRRSSSVISIDSNSSNKSNKLIKVEENKNHYNLRSTSNASSPKVDNKSTSVNSSPTRNRTFSMTLRSQQKEEINKSSNRKPSSKSNESSSSMTLRSSKSSETVDNKSKKQLQQEHHYYTRSSRSSSVEISNETIKQKNRYSRRLKSPENLDKSPKRNHPYLTRSVSPIINELKTRKHHYLTRSVSPIIINEHNHKYMTRSSSSVEFSQLSDQDFQRKKRAKSTNKKISSDSSSDDNSDSSSDEGDNNNTIHKNKNEDIRKNRLLKELEIDMLNATNSDNESVNGERVLRSSNKKTRITYYGNGSNNVKFIPSNLENYNDITKYINDKENDMKNSRENKKLTNNKYRNKNSKDKHKHEYRTRHKRHNEKDDEDEDEDENEDDDDEEEEEEEEDNNDESESSDNSEHSNNNSDGKFFETDSESNVENSEVKRKRNKKETNKSKKIIDHMKNHVETIKKLIEERNQQLENLLLIEESCVETIVILKSLIGNYLI